MAVLARLRRRIRLLLLLGHRRDKADKLYDEALDCIDKGITYVDRGLFLLKLAKIRATEEESK